MGATDTEGRLLASIFKSGSVEPDFTSCLDVPNGGVLLGLPALLSMGLLRHIGKYFYLPQGYYGLDSLFLLLGFMALARLKTIESLRYCSPGEWGKLLGLDRIPEARTMREKIKFLAQKGKASQWGGELSRDWMNMYPDSAGVLYIDGHVRVYSGSQTELPRHHVARQKLCLRATTDYWVNAMDGQPFFMVNKAVDPGLLKVLIEDIVPRLEQDVPLQAKLFDLKEPWQPRFTIIFDREGYSPVFMLQMWEKHIACQTYHKYPGADWPESEFKEHEVPLIAGQVVTMMLAERGTLLSGGLWVREIRKLSAGGHQTSIISTAFTTELTRAAAAMFARWSQENFFKYMREHYNIDRLIDYSTEEIPETTRVVNPQYREIDGEVRKMAAQLAVKRCACDAIVLCDDIEPEKVLKYEMRKEALREEIQDMEQMLTDLKACRHATPKHVMLSDLPEEDQFMALGTKSKYFIDTIKLIAYRAETAMVNLIRQTMRHQDEARKLICSLYATEADILPDYDNQKLTIRLHQLANRCSVAAVMNLCHELNATRTKFPGTNLRLVYEMVS